MTFTFSVQSILAALRDPFNPSLLIDQLSVDKDLDRLFSADSGVWEAYSVREHTLMVLGMFERFHAAQRTESERHFFRLFLALHDIGKPLAIEHTGDKARQAEFTGPILRSILATCGFEHQMVELADELERHDLLGQYLNNRLSVQEAAAVLSAVAQRTGFPVHNVLEYITIFFQSDAGAYTEIAGGKKSLDHLFEVGEGGSRISFSNETNAKPQFTHDSPAEKYAQLQRVIEGLHLTS